VNADTIHQPRFDHDRYCDHLALEIPRLSAAIAALEPATPIPTCPGWSASDLGRHIGGVQRWAAHLVAVSAPERIPRSELDLDEPGDDHSCAAWLAEGGPAVVASLRAADPATPMWAWGADKHARFWSRRMVHETTVHRADAELAAGRRPAIDTAVAADGIDEFLDNLPQAAYFAPRVTELRGDGSTIHFHAVDSPDGQGEWTVRLQPDGFTWEPGHGKADAALRAETADLLLLLYGRLPASGDQVEVFGDRELLARWLRDSAL
jgi:uncharacterized protein (TIGR03083 family)